MSLFCTYLTIYRGNKLPPFYIGSTSVEKIQKGYRGSVSSSQYREVWRRELKQNPHLFKTKILTIFKTRKEANDRESLLQSNLNVTTNCLYINKAIFKNSHVFYTPLDRKGANNPNYGKRYEYKPRGRHKKKPRSAIHKLNLSKSLMGHVINETTRDKIRNARSIITWNVTDPEGYTFQVINLRKWCELHFKNSTSAFCNLTGKGRYKKYSANRHSLP